jgi:hypothetical protein
MMINYDAVFFSQGVIDALYFKQMQRTRSYLGKTPLAPIAVVLAILVYSLSSPQNYTNTGFLFFYPLYADYSIMCLYTSGTWLWVYAISWAMAWIANKKFNEYTYRILTASSLYAYLSHYLYIILIAVTIIRPYQLTFVPGLIIEFVLVNVIIIASYVLFDWLWYLIFPKKTAIP